MREIFVSADGDDAQDGSYRRPVRTLGRANGLLRPGSHIYLRRNQRWGGEPALRLPEGAQAGAYGDGEPPLLTQTEMAVILAGVGAGVADLSISHTRKSAVLFEADDCVVDSLIVRHCGLNGTAADRGVAGYNVRNPTIKKTLVHDTLGGDNIYFYNSPRVVVETCDLARPGPESGDNLHISGATDFYVGRTRFADITSGKGHFLAYPWKFSSTGGVCEHCEFTGRANYGVCLVQPSATFRFNKFVGQKEGSASWSSAFWCANEESLSPINGIKVHNNLVIGYRHGFGCWLPKIDVPVQLDFADDTFVDCDDWFVYGGEADLTGTFSNGVIVASGGKPKQPGRMEFINTFVET